eukprot:TRINITY_DN22177_c0_g1_i1.p2 TRINITY_DN22177_c0_g1~~TRINITY_DN22177_c0_g1_i1.p2  ORF type:complete len:235 (+),score=22.77 TRINITY_DN22177_c0_g1_i1:98-802(+)
MTSPNQAVGEQKAEVVRRGLTEKDQTTKTANSKNHPIQKKASDPEAQTVKISNQNLSETKKTLNQDQADVISNRKIRSHRVSNSAIASLNQKMQHQKTVVLNQEKVNREIISLEPVIVTSNLEKADQEITNPEQETGILNQEKVAQEIISQEQENAISNLRMEIREILNRELATATLNQEKADREITNQEQVTVISNRKMVDREISNLERVAIKITNQEVNRTISSQVLEVQEM